MSVRQKPEMQWFKKNETSFSIYNCTITLVKHTTLVVSAECPHKSLSAALQHVCCNRYSQAFWVCEFVRAQLDSQRLSTGQRKIHENKQVLHLRNEASKRVKCWHSLYQVVPEILDNKKQANLKWTEFNRAQKRYRKWNAPHLVEGTSGFCLTFTSSEASRWSSTMSSMRLSVSLRKPTKLIKTSS